jgi:putative colanic acid biosynthesis acetyltransferase WcaF
MTRLKKTDLSQYDNTWYSTGGSAVKRLLWYFVNVVVMINPVNPSSTLKILVLRMFGAKVGKGVVIKPGVNVKYPWLLVIADHSWIGEKVWIDNLTDVRIGKNCCLSQGSILLTGNHNYKKIQFDLIVKPITLEDGVWIGAFGIVGPGVTCATHSILSVHSFASTDLAPYTIYRGNPALPVKERVFED